MDLESNSQPLKPPLTDQNVQDAQDLAALGHSQALTRKFDMWSMLALAFCVLGTFARSIVEDPFVTGVPVWNCADPLSQEHIRPSLRISVAASPMAVLSLFFGVWCWSRCAIFALRSRWAN
jgi:hypothetical protein